MFADALGVPAEAATILGVVLTLVGIGAGFAIRSVKRYISSEVGVVRTKVTSNGGDTDDIGDTVARIESKLDAVNSKIERHLGWHEAVDRQRLKVR